MMLQSRQYLFLPLGVSKGPSVLYDTKVAKSGLEPTRSLFHVTITINRLKKPFVLIAAG